MPCSEAGQWICGFSSFVAFSRSFVKEEEEGRGRSRCCPLTAPSAVSPVRWAFSFDLWDKIMGLLFLGEAQGPCAQRSSVTVTEPGWEL